MTQNIPHLDISTFTQRDDVFANREIALVVKSQNQTERRKNMLASLRDGNLGRVELREISIGLLVRGRFDDGVFVEQWRREYREPRHIKQYGDHYLLTEVNRVIELDKDFAEVQSLRHPFFAFLHTIEVSRDASRILVTSSGYDRVIEFKLTPTGFMESWCWKGWQHGFNPDAKGFWVTDDEEEKQRFEKQGIPVRFVDPTKYGEQGLLTAERTVHPNVAVYDPYDDENSVLVSCGAPGDIYRARYDSGATSLVCDSLHRLPHGLTPYDGGWSVADTTAGKWVIMDQNFNEKMVYSVRSMGGKPAIVGESEWIQQCMPVRNGALIIDANRGLLAVDTQTQEYTVYNVDEEWCVQDVLSVE